MKQTIAIIGATGNMGSGLGRNLAKAGYRVLLADRSKEKLQGLYSSIKSAQPEADVDLLDCSVEACWEADVVIPAVPYQSQAEVVNHFREVVTGKVVISIANPLNATFDGLQTAPTTSAAEELAALLPDSKIVKAFNTVFASDFARPLVNGTRLDCFIAGDDGSALSTVSQIVADAGFNPLEAGPLQASRTLEQMTVLLIGLTRKYNLDRHTGWKVLSANAAIGIN